MNTGRALSLAFFYALFTEKKMEENASISGQVNEPTRSEEQRAATAAADFAATEAVSASITAEQSSEAATESAVNADIAAAAATGAAIAQSQLIDSVTQAAREDAQRARNQAEAAADEAANQAELGAIISELTVQKVAELLEDYRSTNDSRVAALEQRTAQPPTEQVAAISPAATENAARDSSMVGEGETAGESKRRHGRRNR